MMVRFDILDGKNTVCDTVRWWYGMMVRCGGCTYFMAKYCLVVWYVSVSKVCKSRIRRMNIICNDLIYLSLERTNIRPVAPVVQVVNLEFCLCFESWVRAPGGSDIRLYLQK